MNYICDNICALSNMRLTNKICHNIEDICNLNDDDYHVPLKALCSDLVRNGLSYNVFGVFINAKKVDALSSYSYNIDVNTFIGVTTISSLSDMP